MALFTDTLITEITTLVTRREVHLAAALGKISTPITEDNVPGNMPLGQHLQLLIKIANGELLRGEASKALIKQVEIANDELIDILLGTPLGTQRSWPPEFWESDIGVLVSRVRWWLSADELITISNAAALAFGENTQANRMKIVRAIDAGLLDWIPDPSVANPQHNRRVLRPQVERLGEQRRLPT